MAVIRKDDFIKRRKHLVNLSDYELKEYFWRLADQTITPLLDLANTHTSPAIERSVLLRMGFSSIEAKAIVDQTIQHQLMGKGAGHVVLRYSKIVNLSLRGAGLKLADGIGWEKVSESFEVE